MPATPPPDVFISYAREDRALAQSLAAVCESHGWRVWWDRMTPDGGVYDEVIAANLASARVVVVFWTPDAVASHFVRDEAGRARDQGKLVPARIADTEIPLGFGQFQTRDLGDWSGDPDDPALGELVAQIAKRLGSKATPTPVAARPWWQRLPSVLRRSATAWLAALVLAAVVGTVWYVNREDHQRAFELTLQGLDAKNAKQFDKAVQYFTEAIRADKRYGSPWVERGMLYASRGEVQLARADLTQALQLKLDTTSHHRTELLLALLVEGGAGEAAAQPVPPRAEAAPGAATVTESRRGRASAAIAAAASAAADVLPDTPLGHSVRDMFADSREVRVAATTRLIATPGWQAQAVPLTIAAAMADLDNKDGVINALIYLQGADPAVLQQYAGQVRQLIDRARTGGPKSAEEARKLAAMLAHGAPRVFLHVDDENQRRLARALGRQLRDKGFAVQGIENIAGKATAPKMSEVRVQGASSPEGAQTIAAEMSALAGSSRLVTLPDVRTEQDTYEVWLAKGLCDGADAPRACTR